MSEKLKGDVNWIKNVFPEAVNFVKQELISEFVRDLQWFDVATMTSEEADKVEGVLAKWEERLK